MGRDLQTGSHSFLWEKTVGTQPRGRPSRGRMPGFAIEENFGGVIRTAANRIGYACLFFAFVAFVAFVFRKWTALKAPEEYADAVDLTPGRMAKNSDCSIPGMRLLAFLEAILARLIAARRKYQQSGHCLVRMRRRRLGWMLRDTRSDERGQKTTLYRSHLSRLHNVRSILDYSVD
jgi:hypothetical protein